jgi:predicted house-cleaning noncanonical NTP pyrophosphatase (MazG superfamily)
MATRKKRVTMKLVRDKIPMIMKQSSVKFEARIADNDEYKTLLAEKMQEEVSEYMSDHSVEEAADIYEVFLALIRLWGHDLHDVVAYADEKREDRGPFNERVVLVKSDTYSASKRAARYSSQLFGKPGTD